MNNHQEVLRALAVPIAVEGEAMKMLIDMCDEGDKIVGLTHAMHDRKSVTRAELIAILTRLEHLTRLQTSLAGLLILNDIESMQRQFRTPQTPESVTKSIRRAMNRGNN